MSTHMSRARAAAACSSAAAVGAGVLVTACTSNTPEADDGGDRRQPRPPATTTSPARRSPSASPAPAADHGWIAAITDDAQRRGREVRRRRPAGRRGHQRRQPADQPGRDLHQRQGRRDRAAAVRRRGAHRRSAIKAMEAGIPVVNLDREFDDPFAARTTILRRQLRHGRLRRHYICEQLEGQGRRPVVAEIAGIDALPLTQDRSQGFADALDDVRARRSTTASPPSSPSSPARQEASNLLQAAPKIDAIWNHDDDQGVGVMAAIDERRPRRVLHGRRRRLEERDGARSRPATRSSRRPSSTRRRRPPTASSWPA